MPDELLAMLAARVLLLGERAAHLELQIGAFKLGMPLDRIACTNGGVANDIGHLLALVEKARALDDPLISMRLDLFPSDLPSLGVALGRQHRNGCLADPA